MASISLTADPETALAEILLPYASRETTRVALTGARFVQYTSAESALSILRSKRVWLRNATCMNDWSEVRFGLERVLEAYASPPGQRFQEALNGFHSGLTDELKELFDPHTSSLLAQTYITCFSEHHDDEDDHGRLSMWRAYGNETGVALVMNNHPFVTPSDALKAWTTPVSYVRGTEFVQQLDEITNQLELHREYLRTVARDDFVQAVFLMLAFNSVSLKHVGFREELEWRVVHMPTVYPSTRLEFDHVVVRGVPQPVFKIPMQNIPEEGFTGAEPHELINRIIIGPTQYPGAVRSTFIAILAELGVTDAETKVVCSGIPLRC